MFTSTVFKPLLFCKLKTHYQSCYSTIQQYLYCNPLLYIYPLQHDLYYNFSWCLPFSSCLSIIFFFSQIVLLFFPTSFLLSSLICITLLLNTSNLLEDCNIATSFTLQFFAIYSHPLQLKHFLSCIAFFLFSYLLLSYSFYCFYSLSACVSSLILISSIFLYSFSILLTSLSSFSSSIFLLSFFSSFLLFLSNLTAYSYHCLIVPG